METKKVLAKLKMPGTKIVADELIRKRDQVFLGDLAQILVRAYNENKAPLVQELYEAVVVQQRATSPSSVSNKEIKYWTKRNLDWISQQGDRYKISPRGNVGNMPFVSTNSPTKRSSGPTNRFYRETIGYIP